MSLLKSLAAVLRDGPLLRDATASGNPRVLASLLGPAWGPDRPRLADDVALPRDDLRAHRPQPEAHRAPLGADPAHYQKAGLLSYEHGKTAPQLTAEDLLEGDMGE
jgi:hypothetical protein